MEIKVKELIDKYQNRIICFDTDIQDKTTPEIVRTFLEGKKAQLNYVIEDLEKLIDILN